MELKANERIDDLEFDGLKIIQNTDGFCFGIDSVLLSDFAKNIKKNSKVVDIGTGTGIISILLSKKAVVDKIYGVEIQEEVANMAKRSVQLNGLENKIEIINADIKNINKYLENNSIDVIVSNPPYKKLSTGLKNENEKLLISRHEIKCNLADIAEISRKLLKDKGEIYIVHKSERLVDILTTFRQNNLEVKQLRLVQSTVDSKPNLVLVKAVKNGGKFLSIDKPLVIYKDKNIYSDEILEIYGKIDSSYFTQK